MSIYIQNAQPLRKSQWQAPYDKHKAPVKYFWKELDDFLSCCSLHPSFLSHDEVVGIDRLMSTPLFEESSMTLGTYIYQLRDALEMRLKIPFRIYLRGSEARRLMNLNKQVDGIIKQFRPDLVKSWEVEKQKLQPQPRPNDVDFLIYTDSSLNWIELNGIADEISTFTNRNLGSFKRTPRIMKRNALNETEEALVIAKITDILDITVGTMTEIFNLFTLDAPILLIDPRFRYYSAVSLNPTIFWRGVTDALSKIVRINPRHEKDFYAYLAAIQHATNGYEIIEESSSLKNIAIHFLAKPNVTVAMLCHVINERIKQHRVDGFSFLFNVCMYMPQEDAKREAIWQKLKEEYPSGLPLEDASLNSVVCELFLLRQAFPDHPVFQDKLLIFPHCFELERDLKLRSRIEREIFLSMIRERAKAYHIANENPYSEFLQSITPFIGNKVSKHIPKTLIAKIIDWLPLFSNQDYVLVINKLGLPVDTKREEVCLKILSSSFAPGAIYYIEKKHPEWSPEERFCFIFPHLKSKTLLQRLFYDIKKPSQELLLMLAHYKLYTHMLQTVLPEHLMLVPQEARVEILQKFPQKYWMNLALDPALFTPDQARPILQQLLDKRATLTLFWKSEERGVSLTWPALTPINLEQTPQLEISQRLKFLLKQNKMDEYSELLTLLHKKDKQELPDPVKKPVAPPSLNLDQGIQRLIDIEWDLSCQEAQNTFSNLLSGVLLLPYESQLNYLEKLTTLQREDLRTKSIGYLITYLKACSESDRAFHLRKLPIKLREKLLLEEGILPLESSLPLLEDIYKEHPYLALYWLLEENGVKIAKPKNSQLDRNVKPSRNAVEKRVAFLLQKSRLFECLELAFEFQNEESIASCLTQAMRIDSIQYLPKLLQKQQTLDLFLKLASEKWIDELLQNSLNYVQAQAILKILALKDFQKQYRKHLPEYFETLFKNPISNELHAELLLEMLETKEVQPLLPFILARLRREISPNTIQILERNKIFFFRIGSSSDPLLYELLSIFYLMGIRCETAPPPTFGTFLTKKFKDISLEEHEKLLLINIAFQQMEMGNISREEIAHSLFEAIYLLNNTAFFNRWIQHQPKQLGAIQPLLSERFEWMVELLLRERPELLPQCLAHPELNLSTFQKLLPLIEKHEFKDLRSLLERFSSQKEPILKILIQFQNKNLLDAGDTQWLLCLAADLIRENKPELIMRNPALFSSQRDLGEKAMRLCVPLLLNARELQIAELWMEHFNCSDAPTLALWLSKMLENPKPHSIEKICNLIGALTESIEENSLSAEYKEILVEHIQRLKKSPYDASIQTRLCLLSERMLSKCNFNPSQEILLYTFLASSARKVNLQRCKQLLEGLETAQRDFIFAILRVATEENHEELKECRECLNRSPAIQSGQISRDEIYSFCTLVQVPYLSKPEDKQIIVNALEHIIELNKNRVYYEFQAHATFSIEKIQILGLHYLLSIRESDLFEKYLFLQLISKAFPGPSFPRVSSQQSKVELLFVLVSLLNNVSDSKKIHLTVNKELHSIIMQLIPMITLEYLPYLGGALGALLASLIDLSKVKEEDYAKSIETLFQKVFSFPSSTEHEMSKLELLLNKIFERRFFLKNPSTLIRYELWIRGNSEQSQKIVKVNFQKYLFKAFEEFNSHQLTHRTRLIGSLLYGLTFCSSDEKRALIWYKKYIEAILKIENHPKEEVKAHIKKIFNTYPNAGSLSLMNKVLKYIDSMSLQHRTPKDHFSS